ncbi:MAG: hypothetical protein JO362_19580, partial [Streptomycetaceae bacterium]|nr:hypothetical protein [Streptomycetaceae bacterium]
EDHSQPDHVCNNGGAAQITTSLGVSLGSHSVTDAVTGKRIQVFDGRHLMTPRYLPKGYARTDILAFGNPIGGKIPTPFETPPTPAWTSAYERASNRGYLAITQITGDVTDATGAPVTVNGHRAYLQELLTSQNPEARSVTWFDGVYTFNVVDKDDDPERLATKDQLLKIAESLR